ncbi:MAG: transglutaminase family protein [Bacteroidetes bacterium]|nr:transglutaminase family protein [Bacteroidota bacterium]
MKDIKEINALLNLIDDPDEDVYNTISDKILSIGKEIIPHLEHLWESVNNEETQERIEWLIHRLHFSDLTTEFIKWKDGECDLLQGAIIVAKYHYPDLNPVLIMQELEKLRRNIWLELNSYLTPMEKANVINSILFNYYKQQGVEISYDSPDTFLINKTIEGRKGNAISNGIIYLILCELLDIPVKAINIPRQFILGYFDQQFEAFNPAGAGHASEKIKFYIDPLNGQMYSHKDIENYFKRMSVPPVNSYFRSMSNRRIIQFLLEELSKCFDNANNQYKMDELLSLANMLES